MGRDIFVLKQVVLKSSIISQITYHLKVRSVLWKRLIINSPGHSIIEKVDTEETKKDDSSKITDLRER